MKKSLDCCCVGVKQQKILPTWTLFVGTKLQQNKKLEISKVFRSTFGSFRAISKRAKEMQTYESPREGGYHS